MQSPSQTSLKTAKGTTLPLINLKGKSYLQVAHRLVWFREEHPEWSIVTEVSERGTDFTTMKATIVNEKGHVMSTGHKTEHKAHFPDYMEKAETGAVGRALAMVGYGTQFAPELDEEDRIVDSPMPVGRSVSAPQASSPAQRRPVPPPDGARQATQASAKTGPTATKPASHSEQEDFASFRGGPVPR